MLNYKRKHINVVNSFSMSKALATNLALNFCCLVFGFSSLVWKFIYNWPIRTHKSMNKNKYSSNEVTPSPYSWRIVIKSSYLLVKRTHGGYFMQQLASILDKCSTTSYVSIRMWKNKNCLNYVWIMWKMC